MTNRAHHPADRGSGEFTKDDPDAPGGAGSGSSGSGSSGSASSGSGSSGSASSGSASSGSASSGSASSGSASSGSGSSGIDDAVSREFVLPPDVERELARAAALADDDDDDDATEVVPEPDVAEGELTAPGPALANPEEVVSPIVAQGSGSTASSATAVVPPPLDVTPVAPVAALAGSAGIGEAADSDRVAAREPAESHDTEARAAPVRISQLPPLPPPLPAPLAASELEAPRGDFSGASSAEVTAAELQSVAGGEASGGQKVATAAEGGQRPSFRPPFVDEVPDPVTPYEQRISETVKVADLPPVEQLRGRVLANRYLAEEVAEHTACSISYRTYHLALDRAVTVRVLLRGLACTDEAAREVRRVATEATALEHPNVGATLDFGVLSDGWPFVVTEHFQGNTLATILSSEGKFVLRRVLHVGKQLALGLAAAHEKGLVHGLLSPDNVLVVEPGSSAEVAKILGFGIAKARGPQPGPPRSGVFGVPFYLSPEQAACRSMDVRSDIYSLGVILYELMTGGPPFSDGDFAGVLCQHLDDEAPPPSSRLSSPGALAKALDAIIERCLRKEPEKRYQTAAELADDLIRLEAAAARTKRRPMPEVQKPTSTIHSPHRKADAPEVPGAKVIVHDDVDEDISPPEPPEVASRRSPAAGTGSSPVAAAAPATGAARPSWPGNTTPPSGSVAPALRGPGKLPGGPPPGAKRPSQPPPLTAVATSPRPVRVRVDQATIKISAVDRDRIFAERQVNQGSWFSSVMSAIRRFLANPADGRDDTR